MQGPPKDDTEDLSDIEDEDADATTARQLSRKQEVIQLMTVIALAIGILQMCMTICVQTRYMKRSNTYRLCFLPPPACDL